jgi:4-amino-4-deoxy-L-arabinose transferase-like glycosyltransferase
MTPTALPPRAASLLLALAAAVLLLRLGAVPLLGPDEPRYVRVAVEMHRSGNFVTPTLQGEPWLEKPVLYYWLASASFRVLGETEFAARLPAVLAGLLMIGATALVGARVLGSTAGLHAGFILATSVLTFAYSRAGTMDMLVAATMTTGVGLIGLRLLGIAGRPAIPVAYAFLGLAVLAKGPIGILLPGLIVLVYLVLTREWRFLRELFGPLALAVFCVVALPWYVLVWLDQGQHFINVFFLNHNLARFTSTIHNHPGPFWYYVPVLLIGVFPWSGMVLPAIAGMKPRSSRTDLWLLCWLLVPLAFLSAAGAKLPGYVLPCLAPLALFMGRAAAGLEGQRFSLPAWARPQAVALLGLVLGGAAASGVLLLRNSGDPTWVQAATVGAWILIAMFLAMRGFAEHAREGLQLLRIGGVGLLMLVSLAAPPILARTESGRALFAPAAGREVLAFGAWRSAWMSGYFYNDGKVREIHDLSEVVASATSGPTLVLCGPGERRQIAGTEGLVAKVLADGPRENVLLEVRRR